MKIVVMRFFLILLLTLGCNISFAAEEEGALSRLLAPGPLIEGHKELETSGCMDCHNFKKEMPEENCLKCHKDIEKFTSSDTGFHGRQKKTCIECHADHKGRDYNSTKVNQSTFNHLDTGFELSGKHKNISCVQCHKATKANKKSEIKYLGLGDSCIGCHQSDSVHRNDGKWAKEECSKCHTTVSWSDATGAKGGSGKFDHSKTGFPLTGMHKTLVCAQCHVPLKQKGNSANPKQKNMHPSSSCVSCHQKDNVHKGSGMWGTRDCVSCHSTSSWKAGITFSHAQRTGFQLIGSHASLKCASCHKNNNEKQLRHLNENNCSACHGIAHGLQPEKMTNQNNCGKCHNQKTWQILKFNHGIIAKYALKGKHAKLECISCHKQTSTAMTKGSPRFFVWQDLPNTCVSCHKDVHAFDNAKLKNCTTCHTQSSWTKGIAFSHNAQTEFRIDGKHIGVSCVKCHVETTTKDGTKARKYNFDDLNTQSCATCHKSPHNAAFMSKNSNKTCASCHQSTGWNSFVTGGKNSSAHFNHDADTRFKLQGKHTQLSCDSCHLRAVPNKIQQKNGDKIANGLSIERKKVYKFSLVNGEFCSACHPNSHKQEFSPKFALQTTCSTCHTQQSFSKIKNFDHSQTDFDLRGKHKEVLCAKCHVPQKTTRGKSNARVLHKYVFPNLSEDSCASCHKDKHNGNYGSACSSCHVETSFKATRDFHKNFQLSGVHNSLECSQCHINDRRLSGTGTNCLSCHQKDDIHGGGLSNCMECHGQVYWEATTFSHSMSGFPLTGMHRTLNCSACHQNGAYKGLTSNCFACHAKDAARVSSPVHSLPMFGECQKCHNSFSFDK